MSEMELGKDDEVIQMVRRRLFDTVAVDSDAGHHTGTDPQVQDSIVVDIGILSVLE